MSVSWGDRGSSGWIGMSCVWWISLEIWLVFEGIFMLWWSPCEDLENRDWDLDLEVVDFRRCLVREFDLELEIECEFDLLVNMTSLKPMKCEFWRVINWRSKKYEFANGWEHRFAKYSGLEIVGVAFRISKEIQAQRPSLHLLRHSQLHIVSSNQQRKPSTRKRNRRKNAKTTNPNNNNNNDHHNENKVQQQEKEARSTAISNWKTLWDT